MTILNKDVFHKGNFIEFAYLEKPLSVPENEWPKGNLYDHGLFFEMEIGLLGDYCWLTKQYSPFDPDGYVDISKPEELFALAGTFIDWSAIILRKDEADFAQLQQDSLIGSSHPEGTPLKIIRCDLVETLLFLADKLIVAARCGHTITIVGI